jgi:hypothetical protein
MSSPINPSGANAFSPSRLIAQAAERTGADFDFLMRTASRESNFDASARAATSSAAGMFQFIEQTWFAMVARYGDQHGMAEEAAAIQQNADGRFTISDPARREAVLNLRFDPEAASFMAGELAAENASRIESAIGRSPTTGELYAAHFLGAGGAIRLIQGVESNPTQRADQLFPQAAAANRPVFYQQGRALNAAELMEKLTGEAVTLTREVAQVRDANTSPVTAMASSWARFAQAGYGAARVGDGVLSPAVVEILASLRAPERSSSER